MALVLAAPIAIPFLLACVIVWRRRRSAKPADVCARVGHVWDQSLFSCERCGQELPDPFAFPKQPASTDSVMRRGLRLVGKDRADV